MRIIGIDPGYERLGVAVIEKLDGNKESVIFSDCIRTSAKSAMPDRLLELGEALSSIIKKYKPDEAAIEELYFAKNTTTALLVAEARGVIQYVLRQQNIPVTSYHPNAIKIAVTGHGGATKHDIAFMIPKLVVFNEQSHSAKGSAGPRKLDDELDAIAVAITHQASSKVHATRA